MDQADHPLGIRIIEITDDKGSSFHKSFGIMNQIAATTNSLPAPRYLILLLHGSSEHEPSCVTKSMPVHLHFCKLWGVQNKQRLRLKVGILHWLYQDPGADLEFLKGGFFSLLVSRPHPKPHPFLLFLSKKGGFLRVFRTIENPPWIRLWDRLQYRVSTAHASCQSHWSSDYSIRGLFT